MSFRKANNVAKVEGILSEINLKPITFEKNGQNVEAIGGDIKVLVNQQIDGKPVDIEVPVYMFSTKYTKEVPGKPRKLNPAYDSIEKVMKEFVSIAACGDMSKADKVRISKGEIRMNEFPGQNGRIISQPRIHTSFVARATGEFKPEATFKLEFVLSSTAHATDSDGVELEPTKLNVNVVVPQYTSDNANVMNVDLVPLVATSPNVINAIESYWDVGGTYNAIGRLNFTSRTETVIEEVDFGEPQESVRTINVNELIITGGSQAPLEGDFAFDIEEIKAGVAARKQRLEDIKNGKINQAKKAPSATVTKGMDDLGF